MKINLLQSLKDLYFNKEIYIYKTKVFVDSNKEKLSLVDYSNIPTTLSTFESLKEVTKILARIIEFKEGEYGIDLEVLTAEGELMTIPLLNYEIELV